jgi:hypothetical protein
MLWIAEKNGPVWSGRGFATQRIVIPSGAAKKLVRALLVATKSEQRKLDGSFPLNVTGRIKLVLLCPNPFKFMRSTNFNTNRVTTYRCVILTRSTNVNINRTANADFLEAKSKVVHELN